MSTHPTPCPSARPPDHSPPSDTVVVKLDLNTAEGYRQFLAIKALPRYRFVGRMAHVPAEYAAAAGLAVPAASGHVYTPSPCLFDYQEGISRLAIRKRKFAVFMEPGLGKTLIDFEFAHAALEATGRRVLIVAPLMVVRQMIGEHVRFYPGRQAPEQIRAAGLQAWLDGRGPGFGITNYEAIREGLTRGNLSALILSESSTLKSHYGAWGRRLIELGKGVEWKLCETGTPAPNDRIEYANHAVFLDRFPTVNSFLARFFVNRGETSERWELKPHALRPFYKALSDWCIFLNSPATYGWKDNVSTIPPILTHIHDVPLTDEQYSYLSEAGARLDGAAGGITSRGKLAQLAKGKIGKQTVATNKPGYIRDLVDSWPDESTLIWVRYNAEQDSMARTFPEAGSIEGATPEEDRYRLLEEFQSGKRRVLLSKAECLGFGLNLQVATRQVFNGLFDSYEDFYQCIKRSNRIGSTRPLNVHIPLTEIEFPMMETVFRKAARIEADTREQEALFREVSHVA